MSNVDTSAIKDPSAMASLPLPLVNTDKLYFIRGGVPKLATASDIATFLQGSFFAIPTLAGHGGETLIVSPDASALVLSASTTKPSVALGTGAGTSPSGLSVAGNSLTGTITFITGSSPAGTSATIFTATFATAYAAVPQVSIAPGNAAAALLGGTTGVWSSDAADKFILKSGSAALTAATTYIFKYHIRL